MKRYTITSIALVLGSLAFSGCSKAGSANQTHLAMLAAGHQVSAAIDGVASIVSQGGKTVIQSQTVGEIVIEPARVSLGTMRWTDIPEGAPIQMRFNGKTYSVQWTANK